MAAFFASIMLWFDVEKRYNAISSESSITNLALWFDVEKRYNAITLICVCAL